MHSIHELELKEYIITHIHTSLLRGMLFYERYMVPSKKKNERYIYIYGGEMQTRRKDHKIESILVLVLIIGLFRIGGNLVQFDSAQSGGAASA